MLYQYLLLRARLQEEEGQDIIEYVLIAGLVALVAVVAITATGTNVNALWTAISAKVAAATPK